jgi:hypothetical protein
VATAALWLLNHIYWLLLMKWFYRLLTIIWGILAIYYSLAWWALLEARGGWQEYKHSLLYCCCTLQISPRISDWTNMSTHWAIPRTRRNDQASWNEIRSGSTLWPLSSGGFTSLTTLSPLVFSWYLAWKAPAAMTWSLYLSLKLCWAWAGGSNSWCPW